MLLANNSNSFHVNERAEQCFLEMHAAGKSLINSPTLSNCSVQYYTFSPYALFYAHNSHALSFTEHTLASSLAHSPESCMEISFRIVHDMHIFY